MDKIPIERNDHPMSSLDGLSLMAIDTDPSSNLALSLMNFEARKEIEVVGVIPFKFFGVRPGYLLVLYDKSKDPRHKDNPESING